MEGKVYQKKAMRTCGVTERDYLLEAFPDNKKRGMFVHAISLIASEAGELSGILQKLYQGHGLDKEHVMKEAGDVMWGIAELCECLDTDIDVIEGMNISKLMKRYPVKFEVERSLHRAEGDI